MQLAELLQFRAQTMAERTLRPKLIEQSLCLLEGLWFNVCPREKIAETSLYGGFGKQAHLLTRMTMHH